MDQITDVLTRAVTNIVPNLDKLEERLRSGKTLNVYLGIDPTTTKIHLGHTVPLRKLQSLSELGHTVTFLIGDFTALIGDTSDKDSERPVLTTEQIEVNFQTYKNQAEKILDFSKIKVRHNSEWLKKLNFAEIVKLCRHFSLNDFISRELIKKRLEEGKSVSLPEVLYPIMQGYDSYYLDTDIQIGGTDQTFNMQAGRALQKILRNKESFIIANPFLTGTDGRKMSKSWGNAIWLTDSASDMYGKAMSIKDELIIEYFTLATNMPLSDISKIKTDLETGRNPMEIKKQLALTIVTEFHNPADAKKAEEYFETTVQHKKIPTSAPEFKFESSPSLVQVLVATSLASSNSHARRLIDQGAVRINETKVTDYNTLVPHDSIISTGTTGFAKVIIESK